MKKEIVVIILVLFLVSIAMHVVAEETTDEEGMDEDKKKLTWSDLLRMDDVAFIAEIDQDPSLLDLNPVVVDKLRLAANGNKDLFTSFISTHPDIAVKYFDQLKTVIDEAAATHLSILQNPELFTKWAKEMYGVTMTNDYNGAKVMKYDKEKGTLTLGKEDTVLAVLDLKSMRDQQFTNLISIQSSGKIAVNNPTMGGGFYYVKGIVSAKQCTTSSSRPPCLLMSGDSSLSVSNYPQVKTVLNDDVVCSSTLCSIEVDSSGAIKRIDGTATINTIPVANIQDVSIVGTILSGSTIPGSTSILGKNVFRSTDASAFKYVEDSLTSMEVEFNHGKSGESWASLPQDASLLTVYSGSVVIDKSDDKTIFMADKTGIVQFAARDTSGNPVVIAELRGRDLGETDTGVSTSTRSAAYFKIDGVCEQTEITCIGYSERAVPVITLSPSNHLSNQDDIVLHVGDAAVLTVYEKLSPDAVGAKYQFKGSDGNVFATMDFVDFHPTQDITQKDVIFIYTDPSVGEIIIDCGDGTCTRTATKTEAPTTEVTVCEGN